MQTLLVPAPLRNKLGQDASEGLVQMFAAYQEFSTERFEATLHREVAAVRLDIAKMESRLMRWSFALWISNVGAIVGLLTYLGG